MQTATDQIAEILCEAVEIDSPSDRALFLEEQCAGDEALRAEVENLIHNHFSAGSFLHSPAAPFDIHQVALPVIEQPGSVIGPYKLLQQIGEGGFGVVLLAEQSSPVRRRVALKIIKPGMDTREVVARFEAERQALALMDHPGIARVLDAGATESGRPYFVMELVGGIPITEYCRRHHLSMGDRLRLFVDVCRAVQHAHQKGVIHRDLKPSNIIVTLHDGRAGPKVIDFGISKALGGHLTEKTLFTAFGQMVGTPAYMSPEQMERGEYDVDTRSDVYSLGVILYEMLTGSTPFDAGRLRDAGYAEMQRILREEDPPRPSARLTTMGSDSTLATSRTPDSRKVVQSIRGDLDWIVMKALEKERERRYESAESLARDIQRFLDDEPVDAHPPSAAYRFVKFARRRKRTLVTAALLLSALVTATLVSTWQAVKASRAEQTAQTEAAISRAVAEFINRDLLAPANPWNQPDRDLTVRQALDRASEKIEGRFQQQPLVEAAIRHTVGTSYLTLGEYADAEEHLQRAVEIRRRVLGKEHGQTLNSVTNLATAIYSQGRYEEAERLHNSVLQIHTRTLGVEHSLTQTSMTNLFAAIYEQGRYEEAERLTRELLQIQYRVLNEDDPALLKTRMNLAAVLKVRGHYVQAEQRCREVLQILSHVLPPEHPDLLACKSILANSVLSQGRFGEAEALHREVLDSRKRVLGGEHPSTLESITNLSAAVYDQGRYAEAGELRSELLAVQERILGAEHPSTLQTRMNLANVMNARGNHEEAEHLHRDVYEVRCRILAPDHPDTLKSSLNLANAVMAQGRHAEAEECYRRVLRLYRETSGSEHPDTLRTMTNLAVAIHQQGRFAEAEALRRATIDSQRRVLGPDHPDTLVSWLNLSNAIAAQDRFAEAEQEYRSVLKSLQGVLGDEHPTTLRCMLALARAIDSQGGHAEAEDHYRRLLELQNRVLGPDHPDTRYSLNALSRLSDS